MKLCPKYFRCRFFVCQQFNTWRVREMLWAFLGTGFVDAAVQTFGGKKGGGMLPGIIVPICLFWWGQATLSELSAHFEPPARLPWNIAAARPVCVHDQNKYELHTNKSRQLPCYSTEVVYWENLLVTWYQLIQVFVNGAEQDWWTRWLPAQQKHFPVYLCMY